MSKKILGICAALVALAALAIPSVASATTLEENGKPVATGKLITATQDEHAVFEAAGIPITCSENWMTGEVVKNDNTTIEGTITGASFKGTESETKCAGGSPFGPTRVKIPALTSEGGTGHWCIKNVAGEDKFEVVGNSCGSTGNLSFILEGSITCGYTRASVGGEITTGTGTLKVTGNPSFTKNSGSFLCPGSGTITTMAFNLFTDDKEEAALTIN